MGTANLKMMGKVMFKFHFSPKNKQALIGYPLIVSLALSVSLSACQQIPPAQGLPSIAQLEQSSLAQNQQSDAQQFQAELFWKDQSISFLLISQMNSNDLKHSLEGELKREDQQKNQQLIGMTVNGQVLFELDYDGKKVDVVQSIDAMKRIPFDYLYRDIVWATLSDEMLKATLQGTQFKYYSALQGEMVHRTIQHNGKIIYKAQQHMGEDTEIENMNVPYKMILSPIQGDFLQSE